MAERPGSPSANIAQASPRAAGYIDTASAATGLTTRQLAARAIAALSAGAIPFLLLLPYASGASSTDSGITATGWRTLNGSDIVLSVCSVAVVVCLGLDLFVAPGRLLGVAAAFGFAELGLAWPDLLPLPLSWAAGAYIVLLVAIAECAALVIAYRGPAARAQAPWPVAFRHGAP